MRMKLISISVKRTIYISTKVDDKDDKLKGYNNTENAK